VRVTFNQNETPEAMERVTPETGQKGQRSKLARPFHVNL
jgi:hypothetical protein